MIELQQYLSRIRVPGRASDGTGTSASNEPKRALTCRSMRREPRGAAALAKSDANPPSDADADDAEEEEDECEALEPKVP